VIPTVSFIGHQGGGKTTLLTRLIPFLLDRGYRVGTVKHAPHEENIDRSGTDSFRHREAGAEQTLVVSRSDRALFWEPFPKETIEETIERLFQGFDVVLVEGFKHGPFPKVEVFRRLTELRTEPLAGEIDVVAVVTDEHVALPDGVRILSPRRPEEVADFLEGNLL